MAMIPNSLKSLIFVVCITTASKLVELYLQVKERTHSFISFDLFQEVQKIDLFLIDIHIWKYFLV